MPAYDQLPGRWDSGTARALRRWTSSLANVIPPGDLVQRVILTEPDERENMKTQLDNIHKELIIELSGKSYKKLMNNIFKIKLYGKKCTDEHIIKMCSNIDLQYYDSFVTNIRAKKFSESLNILHSAYTNEGYSIQDILFYFYYYIKNQKTLDDQFKYELIKIITKYIAIIINNYEDELELALFTSDCINIKTSPQ